MIPEDSTAQHDNYETIDKVDSIDTSKDSCGVSDGVSCYDELSQSQFDEDSQDYDCQMQEFCERITPEVTCSYHKLLCYKMLLKWKTIVQVVKLLRKT